MAAGVSMPEEHVELFRRRLNELCTLSKEDLTEVVHIDMALPFSCVSEQVVKELSLLEPFGKANTKPVFAARNNCMQEVIADLQKKPTFQILYYPEINEFRGKRTLQLRVQGYC